ncbi:hypothetical protein V5O48_011048 [Marasmius crinis-equi]|uniref:DUF6593 domain-containing protein n=1 Tax=Marasmius crinis-equi TaxID=585013 RepID=A0ABR3F6M4_9AGAR
MKFYQAEWKMSTMSSNTWYDDDHRAVYKVNTPFKLKNRTCTIIKLLDTEPEETDVNQNNPFEDDTSGSAVANEVGPSDSRRSSGARSRTSSIDPGKNIDANQEELEHEELPALSPGSSSRQTSHRFIYLAQIDWRYFSSSKFRFGDGLEVTAKSFFRKEGWGPYGRHRVFTAKDGKEYKWLLHWWNSELITNDENKIKVAKFTQKGLGIIGKSHPGFLEIFPAGEHMVDEIFMTFVYIERLRKEKENASKSCE